MPSWRSVAPQDALWKTIWNIWTGWVRSHKIDALQSHEMTGRPRGGDAFINRLETKTGRSLKKKKTGQKGSRENNNLISCPRNSGLSPEFRMP